MNNHKIIQITDKLEMQDHHDDPFVIINRIESRLEFLKNDLKKYSFMDRLSDIEMFGEDVIRLSILTRTFANLFNTCDNQQIQKPLNSLIKLDIINHIDAELDCISFDLIKFKAVMQKSDYIYKIVNNIALMFEDLIPYAEKLVTIARDSSEKLKNLPSTITDMIEHDDELFSQETIIK